MHMNEGRGKRPLSCPCGTQSPGLLSGVVQLLASLLPMSVPTTSFSLPPLLTPHPRRRPISSPPFSGSLVPCTKLPPPSQASPQIKRAHAPRVPHTEAGRQECFFPPEASGTLQPAQPQNREDFTLETGGTNHDGVGNEKLVKKKKKKKS